MASLFIWLSSSGATAIPWKKALHGTYRGSLDDAVIEFDRFIKCAGHVPNDYEVWVNPEADLYPFARMGRLLGYRCIVSPFVPKGVTLLRPRP